MRCVFTQGLTRSLHLMAFLKSVVLKVALGFLHVCTSGQLLSVMYCNALAMPRYVQEEHAAATIMNLVNAMVVAFYNSSLTPYRECFLRPALLNAAYERWHLKPFAGHEACVLFYAWQAANDPHQAELIKVSPVYSTLRGRWSALFKDQYGMEADDQKDAFGSHVS